MCMNCVNCDVCEYVCACPIGQACCLSLYTLYLPHGLTLPGDSRQLTSALSSNCAIWWPVLQITQRTKIILLITRSDSSLGSSLIRVYYIVVFAYEISLECV